MKKEAFIKKLRDAVASFAPDMQTPSGDWTVKGFIDVRRMIYTISTDTKVVSKIVELYLFPRILTFAEENGLKLVLTKEQNFYPDLTFDDGTGNLFAVDIKSSYRRDGDSVNGMTLGAFTGYFRNRESTKNITFPYSRYKAHVVLGIIYSAAETVDEVRVHPLDELDRIQSVLKDFQFFVQEKWRIASDRPGSGNTKNIGSVSKISELVNGLGPFAELGEKVFDDYWMNYLTSDMALSVELPAPYYKNLREYRKFRGLDQ
ncbi:MAG: EcoRV family type II restriction endonuclease [Kiritimatiellae bacterium]|nr:EcoRV family type II restriction endonuclease [Kiritimatiellia bacterium]